MGTSDVLDECLTRLAVTGPEFAGGISNHGPMAVEALTALGLPGAARPWLDRYITRLDAPPRGTVAVTAENWPQALGAARRVANWADFFGAELAGAPWRDVLARWWPRLLPGAAGAATHGLIRTAHAARALAAAPTPEREAELARGLAYWAASYTELPAIPGPGGQLPVGQAVAGLTGPDQPPQAGLITETVRAALAARPRAGAAIGALRPPADPAAALPAVATAFAGVFLRYGRTRPIALIHAVTAPTAAWSVLPLLPPPLARPTYDALWQVSAALAATYASGLSPEPLPAGPPPPAADVAERAVASADEHAIKATEACLRLAAAGGAGAGPVLLHAAARASEVLG